MSTEPLGVKPLPDTSTLVVGGPTLGEMETAAWLKQTPASHKKLRHTRATLLPPISCVVILSSLAIIPAGTSKEMVEIVTAHEVTPKTANKIARTQSMVTVDKSLGKALSH